MSPQAVHWPDSREKHVVCYVVPSLVQGPPPERPNLLLKLAAPNVNASGLQHLEGHNL